MLVNNSNKYKMDKDNKLTKWINMYAISMWLLLNNCNISQRKWYIILKLGITTSRPTKDDLRALVWYQRASLTTISSLSTGREIQEGQMDQW